MARQDVKQAAIGTGGWLDDRLGAAGGVRRALDKLFPDHWSYMLGEVALYSFVVLVLTGIYLTFFFDPSLHKVVYDGSYRPLRGQKVSAAYASTLHIDLDVRAGNVIRQMHHWAANVFLGAIAVHMCRIFFTGAFRRPRELNWVVGVTILFLAMFNGFLGYSLPDDLLSGTGLRIAFSIVLSIPVVGSYLAIFFFGGNFPGEAFVFRFYILHVLLVPLAIMGLLGAHLFMIWRQEHTQYPGRHHTNDNVVGHPLWPSFAFKSQGLFLMVAGALALLGGLVQINPIWLYGPYDPYKAVYAAQPDWYMGWLEGSLRLMPSWETVLPGHMIPNPFYPAVLLPALTAALFYSWPWLEDRFTKESRLGARNLSDLPRQRPVRTAFGCAVITFYLVILIAGSDDVLAGFFDVSLNAVVWSLRFALVGLPLVVGSVAYLLCRSLATRPLARDRPVLEVVMGSPARGYEVRERRVSP